MPSRSKKGKKGLRESKITNDFFNQADIDVCPYCKNPSQKHAIQCVKHGGSFDNNPPAKSVLDKGKMVAAVIFFLKQGFPSERRQKGQSLFDAQEGILDLDGVKQALKIAYKRIKSTPVAAYLFPPMDTFDMDILEKVEEAYDILCKLFEHDKEAQIVKLSERVWNLAVTASDVNQSSDDRLTAKLDVLNLNIQRKITIPLSSSYHQIQMFNMDKKFGFMEEGLRAVDHDYKQRRGEDVGRKVQLSFRQSLNNPFKLMESASEESQKKEGSNDALVNLQSSDDALVDLQRNVQAATEELLILKKTVNDAEKPIELPSPPSSFKYKGVPVPEDIPDHVHQSFFDAKFALREVVVLQKEASKQLRDVQCTLATWYDTSKEVWEYGKVQIHDMPRFREYEYIRNSLHAMCCVASRQQEKIVEFYSSKGAPELPQAVNKAFRLGRLPIEEFDKRWEKRCLVLQRKYPSVDQIVIQMENIRAN